MKLRDWAPVTVLPHRGLVETVRRNAIRCGRTRLRRHPTRSVRTILTVSRPSWPSLGGCVGSSCGWAAGREGGQRVDQRFRPPVFSSPPLFGWRVEAVRAVNAQARLTRWLGVAGGQKPSGTRGCEAPAVPRSPRRPSRSRSPSRRRRRAGRRPRRPARVLRTAAVTSFEAMVRVYDAWRQIVNVGALPLVPVSHLASRSVTELGSNLGDSVRFDRHRPLSDVPHQARDGDSGEKERGSSTQR